MPRDELTIYNTASVLRAVQAAISEAPSSPDDSNYLLHRDVIYSISQPARARLALIYRQVNYRL